MYAANKLHAILYITVLILNEQREPVRLPILNKTTQPRLLLVAGYINKRKKFMQISTPCFHW